MYNLIKESMKKYLVIAFGLFVLFSCKDNDSVSNISVSVQVKAPASLEIAAPASYDVVLVNYNDQQELKAATDASGKAIFSDVIPGIYTVTATATVVEQGFSYILSGSETNVSLIEDGKSLDVSVEVAKSGTLVIKEIYYTGSKTPSGASYFRDQFYEIYNNSEQVVYADKLCIGHLIPLNPTATMPVWDRADPDDFLYYYYVFQLPGNGTEYPVQPGESFIIAQMAVNHKQEIWNPNSPVDLSSAEFEAYTPDGSAWVDSKAINMPLVSNTVTAAPWQWLAPVGGPAIAIFFPDASVVFDDYTVRVGSTAKGKHIPVSIILDAVEAVDNAANVQLKRIPSVLDAGSVYASGTYAGESFSRKVKETKEDGRKIYQDTNNSSNDFEKQTTPAIRRNDAKIPSWNTWK
jgi:hypothetical protein